jgi:phosphoribosylformylglycinamidine (FGAM) synthase-like enzyme
VLFGEGNSAVVVSLPPDKQQALEDLCAKHGVPVSVLGQVGGDRLVMKDCHGGELLSLKKAEMADAWQNGLPRAAK